MRRSILLLTLLTLFALTGCGSSPSEPSSADLLQRLFSADEAEVLENDEGVTVRLLDPEFTGGDPIGLSDSLTATLDKFTEVFPEFPDTAVRVEAHADERGSRDYNMRITQSQAQNVLGYLIENCGAPTGGADATGMGEERPLVTGSNQAAWTQNRRVEINIHTPESRVSGS